MAETHRRRKSPLHHLLLRTLTTLVSGVGWGGLRDGGTFVCVFSGEARPAATIPAPAHASPRLCVLLGVPPSAFIPGCYVSPAR